MAMIQLRFFSAPKLGELEFEPAKDNNTGKLHVKGIKNLHSIHLDETSEDVMFSDLGPFDHAQDDLRSLALDSQPDRSFNHFVLGQQMLQQIMIDAVPIVENEQLYSHADYDVQNFLVTQEGTLTGVLDWDGVATYPRCLGYARYPGWITRDWDPMPYRYEFGELGEKEDSPETLRKLRKRYRRIIEEELGEEEAHAMANSHLYEAIEIAARNPMHSAAIVNLLVRRCIKEPLFEVLLGRDDEEDGALATEGEKDEERENGDQPDQPKEHSADHGNDTMKADIGDGDEADGGGGGHDAASLVDHEADLHYIPVWVFDLCEAHINISER